MLIGLGLWKLRFGRIESGTRLLIKALVVAAPSVAAVAMFDPAWVSAFSDLMTVGIVVVVVGLVMGLSDRLSMTVNRVEHLGFGKSLLIGLVQLLAVIPGPGRVTVGLTVGRLLGLERPAAYRFILLSSVPVLVAMSYERITQFHLQGVLPATTDFLAFGLTTVVVLGAVAVAVPWTNRAGLLPFVLYRLVLGGGLIALSLM
jgi:undecaprenyl-diphosphatase